MSIFIFYLLKNNTLLITFINFINQCYTCYILTFFLEWVTFLYIIYQILFFTEKNNNPQFYYFKYITFLWILNISSISIYYFFCKSNLISNNILLNHYVFCCKVSILFLMVISLTISRHKYINQPVTIKLNEIPVIFTFLLLFIFLLLSSYDLFISYLCIEGIGLILYTLGSLFYISLINLEAIIKYFIINNIASSLFLWSISYIYVLIGTTNMFDLEYYLLSNLEIVTINNLYYILLITILSISIKLALFPFHWWIMDVFEGLWTPITVIYAVIIKVTFFLFFFKLLCGPLQNILFLFKPFLLISALGSIIYGSICALTQIRIKRFIAYTSIAQSGYIIIGLACNSMNGIISSLLYLSMYCLITLAFFTVILNTEHIKKKNVTTYLNQLYDLFLYHKEVSFHLILIILVMAALPPFSSFFAKLFIFSATVEAKLELVTAVLLAITLISTFYYLNFIQELIFLKFKTHKLFYFTNNNLFYLKLNSLFFLISGFFLHFFYTIGLYLYLSCSYPLIN